MSAVSSSFLAPAFAAAGALVLAAISLRRARRLAPPRARREEAIVLVGAVDESRGAGAMSPPVALVDHYHWLRDDSRKRADVLAHVTAENEFASISLASQAAGTLRLYEEFVSRLKETDAAVPYVYGPWLYYTRTVKGKSYSLHCRRPAGSAEAPPAAPSAPVFGSGVNDIDDDDAPANSARDEANEEADAPTHPLEQVYFDENVAAEGLAFCDVSGMQPSPDHSLIAFAIDTCGEETYDVRFKRADDPTQRAIVSPAKLDKEGHASEGGGGGGAMGQESEDEDSEDGETADAAPAPLPAAAPAPDSSGAAPPVLGLDDVLRNTNGEIEWGGDNKAVYYLTLDAAHRPFRLYRHTMGTPQSLDALLLEEPDERFWLGIDRTTSGDFLVVEAGSKVTSEVRLVPLTQSGVRALGGGAAVGEPSLVAPREEGVLYEVEHWRSSATDEGSDATKDLLLILTNKGGATNFKLCAARPNACGSADWVELWGASRQCYLTGVAAFSRFLVLHGRRDGCTQLWLAQAEDVAAAFARASASPRADSAQVELAAPLFSVVQVPVADAVFSIDGGTNMEYDTSVYRFGYSSPTTPQRVCEFSIDSLPPADSGHTAATSVGSAAAVRVLKQKAVPNCDPSLYVTRRIWATASDGTSVPVSVVYRPSAHGLPAPPRLGSHDEAAAGCPFPTGPAPLLLYAYGSYGHAIDLRFSAHVCSLADRGCVYAVAHVRGGSEMGRSWYEDEGKLLHKRNTFSDYIAVAEHLIAQRWTAPGAIAVHGASAGGLLCGAVLNARPELWGAVCSDVGFVDVVQSVADPSIPLAVTEWEEWGNPNTQSAFEYILSYSPLDNVRPPPPRPAAALVALRAGGRAVRPLVLQAGYARAHPYPPVLLTAGLNDSRVAYWEAAKFAARLRDAAAASVSRRGGGAAAAAAAGANVLLKTDMGAGHFSYSDRYVYLREKAVAYGFMLAALGVRV